MAEAYGNVIAYVADCWGPHTEWLLTGASNVFSNNTCVADSEDAGFASDCSKPYGSSIHGNQVHNRAGRLKVALCDKSNVVAKLPPDDQLVAMGMALLA